ncbi:sugar transferase [Spirosoma pulveris]
MTNSIVSSRESNKECELDTIEVTQSFSQRNMENVLSKFYLSTKPTSNLYLQWIEDESFVVDESNSFYLLVGKRIVDILISTAVIVFVLSWLLPIIGIIIFIDSPGSIFFIQPRTGYKGICFPCIKFRTMYNIKQTEFKQTSFNDDRVTRVGRFLRKTNLDELPQFINVLLGSMSIVGPRPHAVQHDVLHWTSMTYRNRYTIKPGITGLAQVRGARGETEKSQKMDHRVRYDLFYIKQRSFLFDMKIFFLTIKTMLEGDKNAW